MRLAVLLISMFLGLNGCQPIDTVAYSPKVLVQDGQLQLHLLPAHAPVETPLQLQLTAEQLTSVTGELTGVSMYMGRVPLRFTRQGERWQADFLLGACRDPDMVWQLQLELEFSDGKKRTIKQQFHSSWR